jgi:hypothetical protein
MKSLISKIAAVILTIFALLTFFLSTSVIFDLFGIRAKEGNYVLFVVWSNFISSILYLFAAYGFIKNKKWTATHLWISALILIAAFIGLKLHANSGGIYETKTIGAMIFRISVTLLFAIIAYFTITKEKNIKKKTISLTVISLFLFGCGDTSYEKAKEQTETVTHEEHQHNDEIQTIELNNGEKWKVDANMITHIRSMENEVISFTKVEQKDYKSLAEKLQSNIDLLTTNCTMKGKAHDELHKWLMPYIDMVKKLSEAKDETEASKHFDSIQTSFTAFNQYFQ